MTHAYAIPDFAAPAPVSRPRLIEVIEPAPVATATVSLLERVGELLAACLIVAGGAALVGLCTLA